MFARDFNLLNEIYNQRIYKEDQTILDGVDRYGDNGAIPKIRTKLILPEPKCDACEEDDMMIADKPATQHSEHESNAYMAKQQCFRIAKMAAMLHELICDNEELAPWIATKISQSFDDLNAVFSYKDYEQYREELEGSYKEVEEGTEGDLIDSINRGGDSIVGQIKKIIRYESTQNIEKALLECVKALETKKLK